MKEGVAKDQSERRQASRLLRPDLLHLFLAPSHRGLPPSADFARALVGVDRSLEAGPRFGATRSFLAPIAEALQDARVHRTLPDAAAEGFSQPRQAFFERRFVRVVLVDGRERRTYQGQDSNRRLAVRRLIAAETRRRRLDALLDVTHQRNHVTADDEFRFRRVGDARQHALTRAKHSEHADARALRALRVVVVAREQRGGRRKTGEGFQVIAGAQELFAQFQQIERRRFARLVLGLDLATERPRFGQVPAEQGLLILV